MLDDKHPLGMSAGSAHSEWVLVIDFVGVFGVVRRAGVIVELETGEGGGVVRTGVRVLFT